jgi:aminoglycoside 6'-N-acetyltransferase I
VNISIQRVTDAEREEWFKMRKGIWQDAPDHEMRFDMDDLLASDRDVVFMAFMDGRPAGMVEVRIREYAEGCNTSHVGYLEAWFVYAEFRGTGVAGALTAAAEDWARSKGSAEMASDTWLDNEISIRAHKKLGFREVERLVHFVKKL